MKRLGNMIETYKLMSGTYDAKVSNFMPKAMKVKQVSPQEDLVGNYFYKPIRLLSLFEYMLDESGTAENKVELLFSLDKLSLASY